MLHLDARVHLDKVELAVFVHQKFNRSGVLVPDLGQAAAQRAADLLAHGRRHLQTRRLFDQLLMPPLNRALALKQRDHVAVLIGQHLKLNVPRPLNVFLHVKFAVAKRIGRLAVGLVKQIRQLLGVAHNAHAAPAAAGFGFQNHRVADLLGPLLRFLGRRNHAVGTGQNRHLRLFHRLAGFFLLAHQTGHLRRWPDELDVGRAAHLGKVGVLTQQPIPWVNCFHIRDLGG